MQDSRRRFVHASLMTMSSLAVPSAFAVDAAPTAPARKLRILILGGTGFTGPHQVRYALARGHQVTLFNRGKEPQALAGRGGRAGRRPQHRRPEGAGRARVGRLHRQPDDVAVLGARRRPRAARQGEAVHLHLDRLGLRRERQGRRRRVGGACSLRRQGRDGRDDAVAARQQGRALRPAQGGSGAGGGAPVPRRGHHHPARPHRRPGRRDRPLHLLAGAHRPGRRGARARRRAGPGAVHRRARSRRVDDPHGRIAHPRRLQRDRAGGAC